MDDAPLSSLDPAYTKVVRLHGGIALLPLLAGAIAIEMDDLLPTGLIFVPFALLALLLVGLMPVRRWRSRGFEMGADRLRVVKGVLFHADTVVPFSRVQHIDVEQGPLERAYGIARLILHTAGTHNSSVTLPGLAHADAVAMREAIRAHLQREAP
jgi:membrane protein YdbS with pleckstrin-like domain